MPLIRHPTSGLEPSFSGCQHSRDRLGLLGRENRTESNGASAGESGTVEIELLGNNGSLHKTIPGLSLRARLGALTAYPEEPISTRACRTGRAIVDADWATARTPSCRGEQFLGRHCTAMSPTSTARTRNVSRLNLLSPWAYCGLR